MLQKLVHQMYKKVVRVLQVADHGKGARHYQQGRKYQELEQHQRAVFWFTEALQEDPRYLSAWVMRGISLYRLHRLEEALEDFQTALELDPEEEVAWFHLGLTQLKLGIFQQAHRAFQEALRLNVAYGPALANRGVAALQLGWYEAAIGDFTEAMELLPTQASLFLGRGQAWVNLKNWESAGKDFEEALAIAPDLVQAGIYLAYVKSQRQGMEAGLDLLAVWEQKGQSHPLWYHLQGKMFLEGEEPQAAEGAFLQALELMEEERSPQKQALFLDLMQTSIQLGQSSDLLAWTKSALDAGTPLWEERFLSKLSGGNELAPEMEMLIQQRRQTTEETPSAE